MVKQLVQLQALELERAKTAQAAKQIPAEIARADAALKVAQARITAASDALTREESLRNRLEREVKDYRQRAARFRAQQDSVTTPAQAEAIEHEMRFAEGEASRLEDEEFASLERSENQEQALAAARAAVEESALTLEKTQAWAREKKSELSAVLMGLESERGSLRAAIDPDLLARFDRIAASRGTGIARAESQQCTGCRMGVRPQTWNMLREGQMLTCDSCGRLLYWDDTIAPAPKAPQAEATTSDGHAVRKARPAGA